jgi:hypothetical protein
VSAAVLKSSPELHTERPELYNGLAWNGSIGSARNHGVCGAVIYWETRISCGLWPGTGLRAESWRWRATPRENCMPEARSWPDVRRSVRYPDNGTYRCRPPGSRRHRFQRVSRIAACTRLLTPIFSKILPMWFFTVRSHICKARAISLLLAPFAKSCATCRCRLLSKDSE